MLPSELRANLPYCCAAFCFLKAEGHVGDICLGPDDKGICSHGLAFFYNVCAFIWVSDLAVDGSHCLWISLFREGCDQVHLRTVQVFELRPVAQTMSAISRLNCIYDENKRNWHAVLLAHSVGHAHCVSDQRCFLSDLALRRSC